MSEGLLSYEDLETRWGCGPRQARRICTRLKVPVVDLGHRTKRFRPADVVRAEERAAGQGPNRKAKRYGED